MTSIEICTDRLQIKPLNAIELELYVAPNNAFEKEYGLQNHQRITTKRAHTLIHNTLLALVGKLALKHISTAFGRSLIQTKRAS